MHSQNIHLKISRELRQKIDMAANAAFQTKSAYIREAITLRLNDQYIVKTPDENSKLDDTLKQFLTEDHPQRQNPKIV